MHENYWVGAGIGYVVEKEWKVKMEAEFTPTRKCNANFRSGVARRMFNELPKEVRDEWAKEAKSSAVAAKKEYESALKMPPSDNPIVRQQCLNNVGAFLGPILEGVRRATGCHVIAIVGGPMTIYDGEISTMNVTAGRNLDPTPIPFPSWKPKKFADFMDFMTEYLETAYTEKDKIAAGIPAVHPPEWDTLSVMRKKQNFDSESSESESSDESDELSSSSDSEEETGKKRRRRKSSGGRARKRVTCANEDRAKGPPNRDVDKRKAARKARKGPTEEDDGKREASEETANQKSAIAEDTSSEDDEIPSGPRLSEYEHQRNANIKAIAEDPQMIEIQNAMKQFADERARERKTNVTPRPRPHKQKGQTEPSRHSQRLEGRKEGSAGGTMSALKDDDMIVDEVAPGKRMVVGMGVPSNSDAAAGVEGPATPCQDGNEACSPGPGVPQPTPSSETDPDTAASTEIPCNVAPPTDPTAPEWLKTALSELTAMNLGAQFVKILYTWANVERLWGYENVRVGPHVKTRPLELGKWVSVGRIRSKEPQINAKDLDQFKRTWVVWWRTMQPEWRALKETDNIGAWTREFYGSDWSSLKFPDQNGLLGVLATLSWWDITARSMGDDVRGDAGMVGCRLGDGWAFTCTSGRRGRE
ncbi:uncharacterized protein EV420DRAFT_1643614 [Desarmillaria tabescens]|uniref:Uncharacterized protein n=1 Tax=Armillaria tabescens TaxID=1929756 RepID=A0AA39N4M9_ARMTA|nr:uncharacterized protein EV420DRAFT_1643614 [Desarmillaria tabescens]KAK0457757.1 hypothetical protein EV420DRAFT_1643614 [Desarmillaria tabescens]